MNVEQLVEQLQELPQYYEVVVDVARLVKPEKTTVVAVTETGEHALIHSAVADTTGAGPIAVVCLEEVLRR